MAIRPDRVRIEISYADISGTTFLPSIELPGGACVTGGKFEVIRPAQAGVTVDIGDDTDDDRYAPDVDAEEVASTPLVPTGFKFAIGGSIGVKFSSAPTKGAFALEVYFTVAGARALIAGAPFSGS